MMMTMMMMMMFMFVDATKPRDCTDILKSGESSDGVYTVHFGRRQQRSAEVYCDMTTDGGGWMVCVSVFFVNENDL